MTGIPHIGPVAGRSANETYGRRLGQSIPDRTFMDRPQTSIEPEHAPSTERAAYRWLLELLLDAFARRSQRDAWRPVVCAADGTLFAWEYLFRDHCPRCDNPRWVYLCNRTRALACLCLTCRSLEVIDGIGRPVAFATSSAVATEDLPPDEPLQRTGFGAPLSDLPTGRVLAFVALWPPRPDRRTLTYTPRRPAFGSRR